MNFCVGLAVLALVCASCLVSGSGGIKCYECDTCNDPFDSSHAKTVDCTSSCVKGKYSDFLYRGCYTSTEDTKCVEQTGQGHSGELCVCNSDLCNSSSIPEFSISVAVMMFALRYMLKFATLIFD